jgi:hypothetical protein
MFQRFRRTDHHPRADSNVEVFRAPRNDEAPGDVGVSNAAQILVSDKIANALIEEYRFEPDEQESFYNSTLTSASHHNHLPSGDVLWLVIRVVASPLEGFKDM